MTETTVREYHDINYLIKTLGDKRLTVKDGRAGMFLTLSELDEIFNIMNEIRQQVYDTE